MIEKLKNELRAIEEEILYMELSDAAWSKEYTNLCKKQKVLKKAIQQLERLEVHNK